ncbi:nicotinate-nucleotide adenylyltransferase [Gemelliphila palaticanis]|uniref:Probable nicotinate-nucleotide adenylyltransferase n=1 Tax=Gemelliphila palaticanis TaxID=81950 RepID=A0ABX2SXX2_9BACL|nr:nicotinate-nucleotide adenylyltransferase [Gemella palaticanis]MBF0714721.1 nicotinate (nicotinamide) nucleotide adenylyltransferase [Gemella palaticanis]NYS46651.1 nicotinate (nicotinamide) nucleotide adenylyltransferase [Gemella palaticanis]
MEKIALYGGSFDPIHIGHLITAINVVENLDIDKLIFIPSNITPLKSTSLKASNIDRYNMIKLSIEENPRFEVSNYEINKQDISYTYHTVCYFQKIYPDSELYFIVGTDRVKDLHKWYEIKSLSKIVTFIFVARDDESLEKIVSNNEFYKNINYKILKLPIIELSSTEIREKIRDNKNINYILTPECVKYIKEMNLYEF